MKVADSFVSNKIWRLIRSVSNLVAIIDRLEKNGVSFGILSMGLDTTMPTGLAAQTRRPGVVDNRKIFRFGWVRKEAAEPQLPGGSSNLKCRRGQDWRRPQTGVSSERKRFGLVNPQTSSRARAKVRKLPAVSFRSLRKTT